MKYDTIVIGSGVSGMCTALALAHHGQRVALVEQGKQLAPLLRRFKRDGWWCDPGLHYVGGMLPSGPLSVMFRYLGLDELVQPVPLDRDAYDIIQVNGVEPIGTSHTRGGAHGLKTRATLQIRLPVGPDRVRETLIRHYPASRQAIKAYVDQVEMIHRETPFLNFEHPTGGLSDTIRAHGESLTDFLAAHGAQGDLQEMLSLYGYCLYGMMGDECPMLVHAMVVGSYFFSAHIFDRGGNEIVDAFERRLVEAGVDIYRGLCATSLEVDHDRHVSGVGVASGTVLDSPGSASRDISRSDTRASPVAACQGRVDRAMADGEERLECDACVSTIHPHLLLDLLPPESVRRSFVTRVRGLENTEGQFAVFLAVNDLPAKFRRSNFYCLGGESALTLESTGFAVMACGGDRAGPGRKALCLIRPSAVADRFPTGVRHGLRTRAPSWSRNEAYEELKQRMIEHSVEALCHHFPGLRGKCQVLDAATPCTYESYTRTVGGSAYGLKRSVGLTTLGTRTPLKGLYLAGQSVLAPGLLGVMTSGLLAVSNILGHQTVWDELRKCR